MNIKESIYPSQKKEKKKASESGKSWVNQIYYFFGIDTFFLE